MDIQEITKRFSPKFKHQAIDYTHSNSHKSVTALDQKLSVSYTTLVNEPLKECLKSLVYVVELHVNTNIR